MLYWVGGASLGRGLDGMSFWSLEDESVGTCKPLAIVVCVLSRCVLCGSRRHVRDCGTEMYSYYCCCANLMIPGVEDNYKNCNR